MKIVNTRRFPFVWTCLGYFHINRYGDRVMEPEAVGAMQKEMSEILAEGIKYALNHPPFRRHAYCPAGKLPYNSPSFLMNWWPRGF